MAGKTQTADQRNMRAALLTLVPFGGGRLVALTLCGAIVCKPSVVVPVFRPGAVRRVITPIAPVIPIIFPSFVKGGIRVSLAFAFAFALFSLTLGTFTSGFAALSKVQRVKSCSVR